MTTAYPGLTLVVEDGTGLVDANSYISLADANTYHTNNGNFDWTKITDPSIQTLALMKATQSVDILYGQEYYGIPRSQGQVRNDGTPYLQNLLFPRFTMVINNIQVLQTGYIPVQLKRAVCEIALMWINGGSTDDVIFPQPNQLKFITEKTIKVGGIATGVKFGKTVDTERYPGFWKIDKIIYPLLRRASNPSFISL